MDRLGFPRFNDSQELPRNIDGRLWGEGGSEVEARWPHVGHQGWTGQELPSQTDGPTGRHHDSLDGEGVPDATLCPPPSFSSSVQVKSESLGIPQKLQLKVDVEAGKLIIKKSKDGSEDKFYSHKKSKSPSCS